MSTDPVARLPSAFASILARIRRERNLPTDALTTAAVPTLEDFFRVASALGDSPVILLTEVIAAWRADPADHGLYRSRPSDPARLYKLGYFRDPGDFRELPGAYPSLDTATAGARKISVARIDKGKPPIDTLTIYVRVGHVRVDVRPEAEELP
jgi:hypothetical protein